MESCTDLTGAVIEGKAEDSSLAHPVTRARAWLTVADVMSRQVATVSPQQDVVDAAVKMAQDGISCVIVTEDGAVAGILTETDFLRRVVAQGDCIYQTKVADVMSASVESVSADLSVLAAGKTMKEKRIRRLPVLDQGKLVGIITQTDLTRALTSFGHWRDVGQIMSKAVSEIQTGASVAAAAKLMSISKISSIVVMTDDEVVGVLTQRDVLKKVVAKKQDPTAIKIEAAMSAPVISVPPSYSVFSASKAMEDMNIRRLVVMRDKRVCGIVTQTDIFQAVENKLQTEEEEQRKQLEASRSCIFAIDAQGMVTYVNPAFARLFEVSDPQDLINQPFLADRFWRDPQDRAAFLKDHQGLGLDRRELALKTAQGQDLYVQVYSNLTAGAQGEINGREGVVCDITARKRAEAELAETHRKLVDASRQAGRGEATAEILHRVECASDSIMASADKLNGMIAQSDLGSDISGELRTLIEEVHHIRNIIEAQRS